jgi:hypothetical protein
MHLAFASQRGWGKAFHPEHRGGFKKDLRPEGWAGVFHRCLILVRRAREPFSTIREQSFRRLSFLEFLKVKKYSFCWR